MAFWNWSKTAATNATADSSINWAEGQLPSTVNDSARAMMAGLAKWRDDISGASLLGGNDGVNFTLSSNSGFTNAAAMDGQLLAFTPQVTNTGPVFINVDGVGAFGVRSVALGAAGDLPAGSLVAGTPYLALFNNANSKFFLINTGFQSYSIPLGGILQYAGSAAPNSNFAMAQGQAISRTTYATLFAMLAGTYGAGDGSTTFNVPDLRGRVSAGFDPSAATGRLTSALSGVNGAALGSAGGTQNQNIAQAQLPNVGLSASVSGTVSVSTSGNAIMQGSPAQAQAAAGTGFTFLTNGGYIGSSAISASGSNSMTGATSSINGGVAQSGLIMVQPTLVLNYLIRII